MSVAKIAVLGILSYSKEPLHGYQIKKRLEEWEVAEYAPISYGSIYYNLEKMEQEGLVKGKTIKNSKRPERKLYVITEKGRKKLLRLLKKNYFEIKRIYDPFDIALSFMPLLQKEEVLRALEKRIDLCEEHIKCLKKEKEELKGKIPFFAIAIIDHVLYHFEAEKKWLENLKGEVEKLGNRFEDFNLEGGKFYEKHR